jgi:hypothetical protein
MRVNSREPREPTIISLTLQQITFSWLPFRPFTCLAGFFAGQHSQRTPWRHRRAGPNKQKQRIIGHVRIQYNKECALKWQVPKGKIFVFPKFQGNRSIISGDMTRGVYCVECEFGLRPFFFGGRAHTHTSEHREVKYAGQKIFGSGLKSPFLSNIGHYFHFFSLFNLQVK